MPTLKPGIKKPWLVRRKKKQWTGKRHTNNAVFYASIRWNKLRSHHLKDNPFCVKCLKEGRMNGDRPHVDHIESLEENYDRRLDITNLQTLCNSHHSKKTVSENRKHYQELKK